MEKAKNYATTKFFFLFFLALALSVASTFAESDPLGCSSTSVSLELKVYEEDGVTPVVGVVTQGQELRYEATLKHSVAGACNYEGGVLSIRTPDGATHDVTGDGIPRISQGMSFVSELVAYTADAADANGELLIAFADYENGTSWFDPLNTGMGVFPVGATTPIISIFDEDVYTLLVNKTAETQIRHRTDWDIEKEVDIDAWNLTITESGTSEYTVTVTKGEDIPYEWTVTGKITIYNPTDITTTITNINDEITLLNENSEPITGGKSDFGSLGGSVNTMPVRLTCGKGVFSLPYALGPGETLTCTYNEQLGDDSERINTVTVETEGPVLGETAQAIINFSNAQKFYDDAGVSVVDTNGEYWETYYTESWTYTETFDCSDVEFVDGMASYVHPNTATIQETGQSADAEVTVICQDTTPEMCTCSGDIFRDVSETHGPGIIERIYWDPESQMWRVEYGRGDMNVVCVTCEMDPLWC